MDVKKILQEYSPENENLLNLLHELQDAHPENYLPGETLRQVADYFNTTLAYIYGVVSYYSMFSTKPRGRHIIRVCRSPICQMTGGSDVIESLKKILGAGPGERTADRLFSVELSECLGICDVAPAMMIGDKPYGHLTESDIETIISEIRNDRS